MAKPSELAATAEPFLRPGQVQDVLGVAASTLWNYVQQDLLRPSHHTPGGHARFLESEVAAFKARLSVTVQVPAEVAA